MNGKLNKMKGQSIQFVKVTLKGVHRPPKTETKLIPPETEVSFGWSWCSQNDRWVVGFPWSVFEITQEKK